MPSSYEEILVGQLRRKITELEADIEAYEGMKEGVGIRIADLEHRNQRLETVLRRIDHTLRIPAAEYVPAISDVFTLIDSVIQKEDPEPQPRGNRIEGYDGPSTISDPVNFL